MKYSGIKTDSKLRFLKCPVCGNDEFSTEAEFCRICGSAIYNYCQDLLDESGYRINAGCGKPNSGNSRFCEYCGNPTLLNKFLTHWEDEKIHVDRYCKDDDVTDFMPSDTERLYKKKPEEENLNEIEDTFNDLFEEDKI